jgi:hypothetical protein
MLLILRSTALSSASVATSPFAFGPVAAVPPGADPAEPVVMDDPVEAEDPAVEPLGTIRLRAA